MERNSVKLKEKPVIIRIRKILLCKKLRKIFQNVTRKGNFKTPKRKLHYYLIDKKKKKKENKQLRS